MSTDKYKHLPEELRGTDLGISITIKTSLQEGLTFPSPVMGAMRNGPLSGKHRAILLMIEWGETA